MSPEAWSEQELRGAWRSMTAPAEAACPPADRIVAAADGEMSGAEFEALVEHLAACPSCALAWRLCRQQPAPARRSWPWQAGLALAASLLLAAVGLTIVIRPPLEAPLTGHRAAAGLPAPESMLPPSASLPREAFVLEWSPAAPGSTWDLVVMTEDLEPVVRARALTEPRFKVPVQRLATLPAGTRLVWQVTLRRDGRSAGSRTFSARVE